MGRLEHNPLYKALSTSNSRSIRTYHRRPKSQRLTGNPIEEALTRAKDRPTTEAESKLLNNPLAVALLKGRSKQRSFKEGKFQNKITGSARLRGTLPTNPAAYNGIKRSNGHRSNRPDRRHEYTHHEYSRERVKQNKDREQEEYTERSEERHIKRHDNKRKSKEKYEAKTQTPENVAAALKKSKIGVWSSSKVEEKHVSFKGASQPTFLRIKNLQPGVTELDIVEIMWRYGTVLQVMTKESVTKEFGRSVTAELFYLDDDSMWKAKRALDGVKADNRILKLEIAQNPVTVTDPLIWRRLTSEVKEAKRNRMMPYPLNPTEGIN